MLRFSRHEGDFWCGDDIINKANKDGYALCKTSLSLRTSILRYLQTLSLAAERVPGRSLMRRLETSLIAILARDKKMNL